MKPSTYTRHQIGLGIFLAIFLPLAVDYFFDLGYFGRPGKGILLLMMGAVIVYGIRFAPTRQDMEEYRERRRRAKANDRRG